MYVKNRFKCNFQTLKGVPKAILKMSRIRKFSSYEMRLLCSKNVPVAMKYVFGPATLQRTVSILQITKILHFLLIDQTYFIS